MSETLHVQLYIEPDGVMEGYLSISTRWPTRSGFRRIRAAWDILRGKEYWFSEVALDRDDVERIYNHLGSYLGRNITWNFTTNATSAGSWGDPSA